MSWWVPVVIIVLNLGFGVAGYLLGRKTQGQSDGKDFLKRTQEFHETENKIEEAVEEEIAKMEERKEIFEAAAWNEKMKIISKKRQS